VNEWLGKKQPPFNTHLGLVVEEWREAYVRVSAEVKPEFQNSQAAPHGGFIMAIADVAASFPGVYCPHPNRRRYASTLSMNTNFLGLAKTSKLVAEGRVTSSGRKIFYSQVEIKDSDGNPVASCQAVFRYRSGSELLGGVELEP
jgi:acyl-CoA thioesterase